MRLMVKVQEKFRNGLLGFLLEISVIAVQLVYLYLKSLLLNQILIFVDVLLLSTKTNTMSVRSFAITLTMNLMNNEQIFVDVHSGLIFLLAVCLSPSSLYHFSFRHFPSSYFFNIMVCLTAPGTQERHQISISSTNVAANKQTFCIHMNIFRSFSSKTLSKLKCENNQKTDKSLLPTPLSIYKQQSAVQYSQQRHFYSNSEWMFSTAAIFQALKVYALLNPSKP